MTILELAVVLVIIAILASMLLPFYGAMTARAEEGKCLANIRGLHVAASSYLNSNGSWPQIPVKLSEDNPHAFARNWVEALAPFGAPHVSWICPSLQRRLGIPFSAIDEKDHYRIDFLPSSFDSDPATPRRAGGYPWFMERIASHPRGQLIILADGTATALLDIVNK